MGGLQKITCGAALALALGGCKQDTGPTTDPAPVEKISSLSVADQAAMSAALEALARDGNHVIDMDAKDLVVCGITEHEQPVERYAFKFRPDEPIRYEPVGAVIEGCPR